MSESATHVRHCFACLCGVNTVVEPEQISLGQVFQCPACRKVYGHLYPQGGGRAWIELKAEDVKFHNLLSER